MDHVTSSMNVLVLTYGTRGDVQPFVALCQALKTNGHTVTLATAARFEAFVRNHDINFAPLCDKLLSIIDTHQGRQTMERANGILGILRANLKLMRQVKPLQSALVEDCWAVANKLRPDVIVFHPKAFAAYALSAELKVPLVMALLVPMLVPTSTTPHLGFPNLRLGKWYNALTHKAVQQLMRVPASRILNNWRAEHDLERQSLNLFEDGTGARIPVVAGFSGSVVDRPADWPANSAVTGFWFLERKSAGALPNEIEEFLCAGEPPVCFGFGSMVGSDPGRLREVVLGALEKSGQRGLILSGWGGISTGPTSDGVLEVNSAPHDLLLPRVSMLVHHGGAGTTAAALRSGTPQIVVPFMGDQPFWGQRMQELGVAPDPIRQKRLTVENLKHAIERALCCKSFRASAQTLSETIRLEKGAHHAARFIEQALADQPKTSQTVL